MNEPLKFMASIKVGAPVGHDFGFFKWPRCRNMPADPHMKFEVTERGNFFECVADGYGERTSYRNGSLHVSRIEDLVMHDGDLRRVLDKKRKQKLIQIDEKTQELNALVAELNALKSEV